MSKIKIAVIGGSGIDDPEILKNPQEIFVKTPFGNPSDKFIAGEIAGRDIVTFARHKKGHVITPTKVPFRANIWALKKIGCTHILATTACGSLQEKIKPKDLIFTDQFIDFTKHRDLTYFDDKVVHTPMAEPFCPKLREILIAGAKNLKIPHHEKGTCITIEGPRFSTRAESFLFKNFGADIVNMTTVPEVILARELGICYASIAMATDYDSWKEGEESVTWEIVLKTMEHNAANVKNFLFEIISKINYLDCSCR